MAAGVLEAVAHDLRVLLRIAAERTFGWLGRFRRLARGHERLAQTLAGWHWLAAVLLLLRKLGFQNQ